MVATERDAPPVFVITGPSASGKTAVVSALVKLFPGAARLITTTTRPQRPGEIDGKDYHFLSREAFEEAARTGAFVEWVETYGNYYGSSRVLLEDLRRQYPFILVLLDVRGAQIFFENVPGTRVFFLKPGNIEDLRRRLAERKSSTSPEELERRLSEIHQEIDAAPSFSTVIDNIDGKLEQTVDTIAASIRNALAKRG